VTSAQQLSTDGGERLNVATGSVAGQHDFHRRSLTDGDALRD
jgi:hypothetical protein